MNIPLLFFIPVLLILIVLSIQDIRTLQLPNALTYTLIGLGILFQASNHAILTGVLGMLVGFIGIYFIYLLGYLVKKQAVLGVGDIKLTLAMGALLGPIGCLWGLYIAFISASIVGIILLASKLKNRNDIIPFGPFLCLGIGSIYTWHYLIPF